MWHEETFGPLLPIMAFDTEDQAVNLANQGELGLNGSVWTQNLPLGQQLARRLEVGGCAINEVIKHVGHPGLPFGGVKQSGFGRYRGAEGLLAFSQSISVMVNNGQMQEEPNWFPYTETRYQNLKGFVDYMHGEGNQMARITRNWKALQSFARYLPLPGIKYFSR